MPSYRVIDTAGGEIGIIDDAREQIDVDEQVTLPDGSTVPVVDVYDDEFGQEGGVVATLAVDDGTVSRSTLRA
jgi:hypothetical protein